MMHITRMLKIEAPLERLWFLITDVESVKRWTVSIVSEEPITPDPPGVGYKARVKIKEGSKIVDYESEIATYDVNTHLVLILRGGGLGKGPMHISYRLVPESGGTTLDYEVRWQAHGIVLKLMSPLINMMAKKNTDNALGRLKNLAESEDSVAGELEGA